MQYLVTSYVVCACHCQLHLSHVWYINDQALSVGKIAQNTGSIATLNYLFTLSRIMHNFQIHFDTYFHRNKEWKIVCSIFSFSTTTQAQLWV